MRHSSPFWVTRASCLVDPVKDLIEEVDCHHVSPFLGRSSPSKMKGRTDLKNVWNFGDPIWINKKIVPEHHFGESAEKSTKKSFPSITLANQPKNQIFHHENRERWGKWFSDVSLLFFVVLSARFSSSICWFYSFWCVKQIEYPHPTLTYLR